MNTPLLTAHSQWAERPEDQRYESIDDLLQACVARRQESRDSVGTIGDLRFESDKDGNLVIVNMADGYLKTEPTHWGFTQLARAVGGNAGWFRKLGKNTALLIDNLRYGQKITPKDERFKFLTMNGANNWFQALTGKDYGRIWDADVVKQLQYLVQATGNRFYNPKAYVNGEVRPSGLYASDHDMFAFMIDGGSKLDIGPRAQLNRGFFVWNSEVGAKTFGVATFIFNEVCGNHQIWGATDFNKKLMRHSKGAPHRFMYEILPLLRRFMDESDKPIADAVKRAQGYMLDPDPEKRETWLREKGKFTQAEAKSIIQFAKAEEGDWRTLWQVVQGGTAYARGIAFMDARVEFETRVGKLMDLVKA